MDALTRLLTRWRTDPAIGGNITTWHTFPPQAAQFRPLPQELHPALKDALNQTGIRALYTHQAIAWDKILAKRNIGVTTNTASGKTLCYNLPVLQQLLQIPTTTALYIYPTKALAHDQLNNLQTTLQRVRKSPHTIPVNAIHPAAYDGDTAHSQRSKIRQKSRLIVTNPDMLHTGILPHHVRWETFFSALQFIVLDEMHTYRGVFGSHVANILRRLKRIAAFYGASPQFILTSATIGNPKNFAEKLIEAPVEIITENGAGRGPKHFAIYNPPIIDPDLGLRAGIIAETVRLGQDFLTAQIQTIIFGRTRRTVELILRYLKNTALPENDLQTGEIKAYRSGYLASDRREIEAGLRNRAVQMVVATTALELGIDIGQLSAAILAGYPGSIAGLWQQAGRAGRGTAPSAAILIASNNPLDQFLAKHPEYLFEQTPEHALIEPDNLLILLDHIQCAAYELPFAQGHSFGNLSPEITAEFLNILVANRVLHKSHNKYFWMADQYPAGGISLRTASAARFSLQTEGINGPNTIGEVDGETALWMVHPNAIYLHQGEQYRVEDVDIGGQRVSLRAVAVDYYTRTRQETEVSLIVLNASAQTTGGQKQYGEVQVVTQIDGFHKIKWSTHEKLGFEPLDLPPSSLQTQAYWLSISEETNQNLRAAGLWNSDPNDYGVNWAQIRAAIRQRDQFTCQSCGVPEQQQAHHVHHKIPFRAFSDPQEANQPGNLITLCPRCHQWAERSVRIRSGLAGLAHLLGNLAPLFLMCDSGDLGVHHDPKSKLADGNAVVSIYERTPGGIGFSQRLFEIHDALLEKAKLVVTECECEDGCPSCVGPGGEEGSGSKAETRALIEALSP